ncbi:cell cycle regulator of non-homologous end joining [Scleropages formosus]|uniref:cell cycle regulator of non-homologous end joining n=1 Tax=Scleropages formosus TaxID=113540 RepID=UPI000878A6EA|nr:cell cycle regulator of non-homologous end joining-like [Scleropages formosus]
MDEKPRNLPSWMLSEEKPSAMASHSDRKIKGRQVERVTVYCMNEAELVETALRVLTEGNHGDHRVVTQSAQRWSVTTAEDRGKTKCDTVGEKRKFSAHSSSDEDDKSSESLEAERTYVSKTDLKGVAEEETLRYTDTSDHDHAVKPDTIPQPTVKGQRVVEASGQELRGLDPAGDAPSDEGLQLLREIFFA